MRRVHPIDRDTDLPSSTASPSSTWRYLTISLLPAVLDKAFKSEL